MAGTPPDLWIQRDAELRYPTSCPSCGASVASGALEIRGRIDGTAWARWPHCDRCVATVLRRAKARSILGWSLLAGFTIFGGAIALQFMNTGISDSSILAFGWTWLVAISVGSGVLVGAWLTWRGGWRKPVGVRFKGVYWGSDDLIPLADTPVFVRYRFRRVSYRDELFSLNPGTCDVNLESMKSREKAERALASLQTPEEASLTASVRQQVKDVYDSPWDTSFSLPMVVGIVSGFILYAIVAGKLRKPGVDHAAAIAILALVVFLTSWGTFLRIEVARRVMALLTLSSALVLTALVAAHWSGLNPDKLPWQLTLFAGGMWYSALSLDSPAARRLCSRWGRLGRFFGKPSA